MGNSGRERALNLTDVTSVFLAPTRSFFQKILKDIGVCAYQDVDKTSGKRMKMLAQLPAQPHQDDIQSLSIAPAEAHCAYIGPGGGDYRGKVNVIEDGTACLSWPKTWAGRYHGSGLAKDEDTCSDIPMGSRCWEVCVTEQETNNFCRNPTDAVKPFCRTGGTDEAPVFRTCGNVQECPDTGCSHDLVDGSDYTGKLQQLYTSNDFNAEIIGNVFNDPILYHEQIL